MRRTIALLLVVCMIFVGCKVNNATKSKNVEEVINDKVEEAKEEKAQTAETAEKGEKKLSIVTTVFPAYDWAREITKDNKNVELTMLLDNGTDLHSFQPSADDIVKIVNSDVFIHVGGESDNWVKDIIKNNPSDTRKVINLVELLGDEVKTEELKEGMTVTEHAHDHGHKDEHDEHEHEDEHDHDNDHDHDHKDEHDDHEHEDEHDHDHDHHHHHGPEVDEHIWLSLKNAKHLVKGIAEKISEVDPANELYKENAKAYIAKLDELDKEYEKTTSNLKNKTLIFGDRFPFRYMIEDYNLDYYAAFVGCSADVEASFETIKFLSDKVDELDIDTIFIIDNSDGKIARTIAQTAKKENIKIEALDSMQTTTAEDVKNGVNYLGIMEDNLKKIASL